MDESAAQLARLEQAFAEERRARQAGEARMEAALQRLTQALSTAQTDLAVAIGAEQAERERLTTQQTADREWLSTLAEHVNVAQRENHGWVTAEQAARIALEAAVMDVQQKQAGLLAVAADRNFVETSLRAEVLALSHIVEDLAAAVFPAEPAPVP